MSAQFLSLNDPSGPHVVRVGRLHFSISGHAGGKAQFASAAWRAAGDMPELVLALHPHLAPAVSLMKLRNRGFRSIIFSHGVEVWRPLRWLRGAALRRADVAVGPSEATVEHLISTQRLLPSRVQRLPWALDPDFEARIAHSYAEVCPPPADFPRSGPVILTVGRWDSKERYKGADALLAALSQILPVCPTVSLVLAGDGDDRPRLEQLARDLGVAAHTRFLHGLRPEDLFACYAGCSIFALPSRGEGFGLVFLEAMALGKPVIGGAHGGIPDIVQDGVSGLLVTHGDVGQLARSMQRLLTDPILARQLGENGRTRVSKEFSFQRFESALVGLLDRVLVQQTAAPDSR